MPPSVAAAPTDSLALPDVSALVEKVEDLSLKIRLERVSGDDAQRTADFLSSLLHEDHAFSSEDRKHLLTYLQKIVKSTQTLPQRYKLQEVRVDFSQAREGGAFADIFQGVYQGRKVCVKAVRIFQKGDNTRMLRTFAKEIILWAHLSHENILPFYGIHQEVTTRISIISPWMDKGDLWVYLQNSPQEPRLPLALDVTAGLGYLHQLNIVHGDLKAKNVLVSDQGRALIADFGLSRIVVATKLISTQWSSGTMRWMAPELLDDDDGKIPPVTCQSDVWSLGCVYYEIFTRKAPFYHCASDMHVSLVRHKDYAATPSRPANEDEVDKIGDYIWDLMNECWNCEPSSRPNCDDIHKSVTSLVQVGGQQSSKAHPNRVITRSETSTGTDSRNQHGPQSLTEHSSGAIAAIDPTSAGSTDGTPTQEERVIDGPGIKGTEEQTVMEVHDLFQSLSDEDGATIAREKRFASRQTPFILPDPFYMPTMYLRSLEAITSEKMIFFKAWCRFVIKLHQEWDGYATFVMAVLAANLGFLATSSVDNGDPPEGNSAAQICSYFSIVSSVGIVALCQLIFRYHRMKGLEYLDEGMTDNADLLLAITYSLPCTMLGWSATAFFMVCLITWVDGTTLLARCLISATSAVLVSAVAYCIHIMHSNIKWWHTQSFISWFMGRRFSL